MTLGKWIVMIGLLAGCRPQGLPAEPSGADAADPEGPVAKPTKPQALERSAFEGVRMGAGGHEGHGGHGGHTMKAGDETPAAEGKDKPKAPDAHADHGGQGS